MTEPVKKEDEIARGLRVVRIGHGANCSSIGSVVDTLFASAVVGGVLLTAIAAAIAREKRVVVVPSRGSGTSKASDRTSAAEDDATGGEP